ncbi:MAG: DNA glycosylase [Thermoplasmata archaeon]
MRIEVPYIYNLEHTFRCGQAFRWKYEKGFWNGITNGELIFIREVGNSKGISKGNSNEKTEFEFFTYPKKDNLSLICSYFRLEDNMPLILKSITKDKTMRNAIEKYKGLHLLRQEPFESLITYLFSAQSSIPIISRNVEVFSQKYGKRIEYKTDKKMENMGLEKYSDPMIRYSFPNAEDLKCVTENELRRLGLGFRAKWVKNAIDFVNSGKLDFEELRDMEYGKARNKLMEVKGVGPKIADCVLLFSLDKLEAFPVDRWIKRILEEEYFRKRKVTDKSEKRLADFAREYFGKYAGYAQEYLFYYRRRLEDGKKLKVG